MTTRMNKAQVTVDHLAAAHQQLCYAAIACDVDQFRELKALSESVYNALCTARRELIRAGQATAPSRQDQITRDAIAAAGGPVLR